MRYVLACMLWLSAAHTLAENYVYIGINDAAFTDEVYYGFGWGGPELYNELEWGINRGQRQLAFYGKYDIPLWRDYVHALIGLGAVNFWVEGDGFWSRLTPDVAVVKGGLGVRVFGPLHVEGVIENSYFGPERARYNLQLRWKF